MVTSNQHLTIVEIIRLKKAYRRRQQIVPKHRTKSKDISPMLMTNTRSKANQGERKEITSFQARQATGKAKSATQQTQLPWDQEGMSTIETESKSRPYHHMKLKLKTHVENQKMRIRHIMHKSNRSGVLWRDG